MLSVRHSLSILIVTAGLLGAPMISAAQDDAPSTPIIVHSKYGGQIFGFDIDQNGSEGVLSEAQTLPNGSVLAAVETFDQKTGNILAVLARTETPGGSDFVTLGVVGSSVGVIEYEHVVSLLNVQRTFHVINPLSGNKFTGTWTPPIAKKHLLNQVSRNQGTPNNAVFVQDISGTFTPYAFSANIAANTAGPIVKITDSLNFGSVPPPMAYNPQTNQAILGGGDGCFGCFPVIGIVDFGKAAFSEFTGTGFGFVNGIAVDAADNIVCTTTEDDATVEFYLLSTNGRFGVVLPNSGGQQFYSGADVEFDAVNKLFFVAQPNSSVSAGSTIYIYNTSGVLQETLNGFSFSNAFNVVPAHIALNPSARTGFVDGPSANVNEIQGFSY